MASLKENKNTAEKKDDSYRISEILRRIPNRFLLSIAVAKRARQLKEGARPLIDIETNNKTLTTTI